MYFLGSLLQLRGIPFERQKEIHVFFDVVLSSYLSYFRAFVIDFSQQVADLAVVYLGTVDSILLDSMLEQPIH